MKRLKILIFYLTFFASTLSVYCQIPHLEKRGDATQFIVSGKPFLMLAGEVNNSSGSYVEHIEQTMKAFKEANFNSLLVSVSWEIIEPQKGVFDFTSVDELIRAARENDLKLGLLWFASWKNGLSPYAPIWVLNDTKRFVRVKDEKGQNTRTLSPFCIATRDADAKAYTELMKHIAAVDATANTVIVMQIENEVGVLRQTRDFSKEANKAFTSQVPSELIQYMQKNRMTLEAEPKADWENNGSKTNGTWNEVFGQGDHADMFFMAWHYARYINTVAEAGKRVHNLPMYVNCWMSPSRPNILKPGNFPSGGPVLSVLDIWKAAAPSIDILAPDIYGADFKDQANNFHRPDNPLFIPETRTNEGAATWAFAEHDAICFAPFGIDTRGEVMAREYGLLDQMIPVITEYQGTGKMSGIYKHRGDSTNGREFILNKDVKVTVNYQQGFRRPVSAESTNNQQSQRVQEPPAYGLFIQTGENEFLVAGYNLSVTTTPLNSKKEVWLKDAWEGIYESGVWIPKVLHNGDEAGFLRGDDPAYSIRSYKTTPSEPGIFKFKVVVYDR
jgi:hypothetical protein